jgi:acetamidase/formamidase
LHKSHEIPHIEAGPDTVHWGFFDAKLLPILTIDSGDRVTISSVSDSPELLPPPPFKIPPALPAIHAANGPQRVFGHMCTGPVAVRGAKVGQTLQLDIEAIDLHYDWGYNLIRPLAGALPDDFPEYRPIYISLDKTRMMGRLPWGQEIPLRPFFGVMAVAPPPAWGTI